MSDVAYKDVLVRKVDVSVLAKLKENAKRQNRSLQAEMTSVLGAAAEKSSAPDRLEEIRRIRASIKSKQQTDSVILLREDRDR